MQYRLFIGILTTLMLWGTCPGTAQDPVFWVDRFDGGKIEEGAPVGWSLEIKTGRPGVRAEKEGQDPHVLFNAKASSFGVKKEFELDIKEYPFLNWRWKVTRLPEKGNFKKKETDDQAAQLYVIFPRFPARLNSDFLCYYWDSDPQNKGATGTSVAWSKAKIIVLQAGKENLNQWITEKRNVYEDYKRMFQKEPPQVGGLAFYINSQHTGSEAEAAVDHIYFSKK